MEKKLTKSDFFWAFIRSNFLQASWNMERMQALGFAFGMVPILRRLYTGDDLKQALKRHLEFYNTQPFVTAPIIGITAALEEKKANGADIPDSVINGIKVGMMGPLAGVGDPIFWGTLRPITAALGASFALSGSILGPIIFFVLFNAVRLWVRWYGIKYGYAKGTDIVQDIAGNKLQKLTEGASILGLFVMGALVNKWTSVNIPVVVSTITNAEGRDGRHDGADDPRSAHAWPRAAAHDLCLHGTAQAQGQCDLDHLRPLRRRHRRLWPRHPERQIRKSPQANPVMKEISSQGAAFAAPFFDVMQGRFLPTFPGEMLYNSAKIA
jgi:PTS system mannose-specific IID component